jgi:hypothetical protein
VSRAKLGIARCLRALRRILYATDDDTESDAEEEPETNDDDPMKEWVFKACMAVFDDYLGDEGWQRGSYQLVVIDAEKESMSWEADG